MPSQQNTFTEPIIITTNDIKHRSYVTFYFNDKRIREYHGESINLNIQPNRAKTLQDKQRLLLKLQFELHKALDGNHYLSTSRDVLIPIQASVLHHDSKIIPESQLNLNTSLVLFNAIKTKLRSDLSRTYKRDLKSVYRAFKAFITKVEADGSINNITKARVELFLSQYGSTGTYYMNKRRTLGVLFNASSRVIDKAVTSVKETPRRKVKSKLHEKYAKDQLKPIFSYLKANYPNLYLCCLLTYGSWLRPHEEIRLLTVSNFYNDYTEIRLSGDENKGGKVRVVYVPDYIQVELVQILKRLNRNDNIFSLSSTPYNYSYFNTQWSRAYKTMFAKGLVFEDQTIYSFRHTAAVQLYRRTKDVYLLQKLLGHSNIIVTLKYLRTLGELNTNEMKEAAPQLD